MSKVTEQKYKSYVHRQGWGATNITNNINKDYEIRDDRLQHTTIIQVSLLLSITHAVHMRSTSWSVSDDDNKEQLKTPSLIPSPSSSSDYIICLFIIFINQSIHLMLWGNLLIQWGGTHHVYIRQKFWGARHEIGRQLPPIQGSHSISKMKFPDCVRHYSLTHLRCKY